MGATSLRARVALLAVVGAVAIALLAGIVWSAFADARRVGSDVTTVLSPAAELSQDLGVAYAEVDRRATSFVLAGRPGDLLAYRAALARADHDLAEITRLLRGRPALEADVAQVTRSVAAWIPPVVEPAVAARSLGPLPTVDTLVYLARSASAYSAVSDATSSLGSAVSDERDAATDALAAATRRMATALGVAAIALLVLLLGAYLMLRRWVLRPLDELREQLRAIAQDGQRERVIVASGPPELVAAGTDAEAMRRALVSEGDAARAALEGLHQEGPVVSALRADLTTESEPAAARLDLHGQVHAATGVIAGDWWGVVPLDGERTALLLIDVSGHGELAGLVTQQLRAVIAVALRSGYGAGASLERGAISLVDDDEGRTATALVVVFDPAHAELTWANAGHPAPWLLRAGGARTGPTTFPLTANGPLLTPLGGTWTTSTAVFEVDDVLLAWSDGLVESRDASREVSDSDLATLLDSLPTREPRVLVPAVLAGIRQDAEDWSRDDVTLIGVRRRE